MSIVTAQPPSSAAFPLNSVDLMLTKMNLYTMSALKKNPLPLSSALLLGKVQLLILLLCIYGFLKSLEYY